MFKCETYNEVFRKLIWFILFNFYMLNFEKANFFHAHKKLPILNLFAL